MKPTLIVLVGPSGAGKTTLARLAAQIDLATHVIRSVTTRAQGPNEDDFEYVFIKKEDFDPSMCIENAEYDGNYYGILKDEIEQALATERPIAAAEIHGARQIKEYCKDRAIVQLVFVDAPDKELRHRLETRGRGNVDARMARVEKDRESRDECDFIIVNRNNARYVSIEALNEIYNEGSLSYA